MVIIIIIIIKKNRDSNLMIQTRKHKKKFVWNVRHVGSEFRNYIFFKLASSEYILGHVFMLLL